MPGPGGVLALDLSSRVGWAYGRLEDERPRCGSWLLAGGDLGRTLASFENELEDAIVLHRPALIMAEAPLPATAISNAATWRQQLGLSALAETAAYRHEIRFREQAASTIRSAVLGTCRFPKGEAKAAILAWCEQQGWAVPDHDAGDACVVWTFTVREIQEQRRAREALAHRAA